MCVCGCVWISYLYVMSTFKWQPVNCLARTNVEMLNLQFNCLASQKGFPISRYRYRFFVILVHPFLCAALSTKFVEQVPCTWQQLVKVPTVCAQKKSCGNKAKMMLTAAATRCKAQQQNLWRFWCPINYLWMPAGSCAIKLDRQIIVKVLNCELWELKLLSDLK